MKAYHFVGKTLRDGSAVPEDGKWLEVKGAVKCCEHGLHASLHVADAVRYAPGNVLCLVELEGKTDKQADKLCAQRRKIIARFDATDLLRADAIASALSVAHLWNMPPIVQQYFETGDETIRVKAQDAAAAYAAYAAGAYTAAAAAADYTAAAYAAAAAAAYAAYAAAACAAAYTAAAYAVMRKTQRARLKKAVDAKFKELIK